MVVVAVGCLLGGLLYLPLLAVPFGPNASQPMVAKTSIVLPSSLTRPIVVAFLNTTNTQLTVELTDGDAVVGVPLTATVYLDLPAASVNVSLIFANIDNALIPTTINNGFLLPEQTFITLQPFQGQGYATTSVWTGSSKAQFQVEGVFGMTLLFYHPKPINQSQPLWEQLHNPPFYTQHVQPFIPIGSSSLEVEKKNYELSNSLSFFILFFAALEVRAKTSRDYCENGKTKDAKPNRTVQTKIDE
jgi:hypothetical protein